MKIKKSTAGGAAVALAYVMWGMLTVFWNLLTEVNSVYILSQRVIWSMVFMGLFIAVTGGMKEIKELFRNRKDMLTCFICGILVTVNWGVYIYAVNSGHVLDASLGYFIEPVLVGLMGLIVFREKPGVLEKITFVCAVIGLAFIVIKTGTFPYLSIIIAGSFAVYGAVKKKLKISAQASLFTETLFVTPAALIFMIYAEKNGMGAIGTLSGAKLLLLPACGIVTSVPLLMFNRGVKEIPYYFSGILMYINPTLQFIMGLFYFKEALDVNRLIAFIIIWVGVLFTVADKIMAGVKASKENK